MLFKIGTTDSLFKQILTFVFIFCLNLQAFGLSHSLRVIPIDTEISFELPEGNLHSVIILENDPGLPSISYFFTGMFLFRITIYR